MESWDVRLCSTESVFSGRSPVHSSHRYSTERRKNLCLSGRLFDPLVFSHAKVYNCFWRDAENRRNRERKETGRL